MSTHIPLEADQSLPQLSENSIFILFEVVLWPHLSDRDHVPLCIQHLGLLYRARRDRDDLKIRDFLKRASTIFCDYFQYVPPTTLVDYKFKIVRIQPGFSTTLKTTPGAYTDELSMLMSQAFNVEFEVSPVIANFLNKLADKAYLEIEAKKTELRDEMKYLYKRPVTWFHQFSQDSKFLMYLHAMFVAFDDRIKWYTQGLRHTCYYSMSDRTSPAYMGNKYMTVMPFWRRVSRTMRKAKEFKPECYSSDHNAGPLHNIFTVYGAISEYKRGPVAVCSIDFLTRRGGAERVYTPFQAEMSYGIPLPADIPWSMGIIKLLGPGFQPNSHLCCRYGYVANAVSAMHLSASSPCVIFHNNLNEATEYFAEVPDCQEGDAYLDITPGEIIARSRPIWREIFNKTLSTMRGDEASLSDFWSDYKPLLWGF